MTPAAQAEVRALARKWLQGKSAQHSILEAAYNRYAFNDGDSATGAALPRWFRDDEAKHMMPAAAVSRAEVAAERDALRAIDARPLKKVRELSIACL